MLTIHTGFWTGSREGRCIMEGRKGLGDAGESSWDSSAFLVLGVCNLVTLTGTGLKRCRLW